MRQSRGDGPRDHLRSPSHLSDEQKLAIADFTTSPPLLVSLFNEKRKNLLRFSTNTMRGRFSEQPDDESLEKRSRFHRPVTLVNIRRFVAKNPCIFLPFAVVESFSLVLYTNDVSCVLLCVASLDHCDSLLDSV